MRCLVRLLGAWSTRRGCRHAPHLLRLGLHRTTAEQGTIMTRLHVYEPGEIGRIMQAVALLPEARSLLMETGAGRLAAAKVRRAIKSAEAARRHVERIEGRAAVAED